MNILSHRNPKSPITEIYNSMRTNIAFSSIDNPIKTIVVTSSKENEGKSTVISNLAASFAALDGKKVLLIDGDLRNPSQHKLFGVSNSTGIIDVLKGSKNILECIKRTEIGELHILTTGEMPPNPAEILGSNRMRTLLEELGENYDYIFIDTPPIGLVTDASILSAYADGTILVVSAKEVDKEMAKIAVHKLEEVNAKILGAVLNKYENKTDYYGHYGYYYSEQKDEETTTKGRRRRKNKKKFK